MGFSTAIKKKIMSFAGKWRNQNIMLSEISQSHRVNRNGILLCHKEEQNYVICRKMDGTREYYAK